jgi:hypothetical protein
MWPLSMIATAREPHDASAYRDPFTNKNNKCKLNADVANNNDLLQLLRKVIFESRLNMSYA